MKSEIHVTGMRCHGCEILITEAIEELDGVVSVKASHETGVVLVEFDESKVDGAAIKSAIESQGFTVTA
jgi:copper chaperone